MSTSDRALRRSVRRIAEFWSWWAGSGRAEALRMLDSGDHARFVREIDARSSAIDKRLSWHTEPGLHRPHRLVLSSGGAMEARGVAERWRRSAPADDLWEFAASRAGGVLEPGQVIEYAGRAVRVDDVRFGVDEGSRTIDVRVRHPSLAGLAPTTRSELGFLLLDLVLGEDDVERFVGGFDAAADEVGGLTAAELREAVARIEADDAWSLVEATYRDGSTAVLQVGPRLHPLDHLPFDRHTALMLRYEPREDGLAANAEVRRVQEEQSRFEAALGGSAVTVVTEMHAGTRTVHLYSDGADANAVETIERLARGRRDVRVRHSIDPAWRAVAEYRRI